MISHPCFEWRLHPGMRGGRDVHTGPFTEEDIKDLDFFFKEPDDPGMCLIEGWKLRIGEEIKEVLK